MKEKIKGILIRLEKRDLIKAMFAGFILAVIFSFLPFFASCEEISDNIIRLHVIANSDTNEDQQIKLQVRDAVLSEAAMWYEGAESFEEANTALCTHLGAINKAAENVLGNRNVKTEVTKMYFSARDYENFSLPAGEYRTLRVTIGKGQGKNWWCMVYPSLCLPVADDESSLDTLTDSEADIIKNPENYKIKFKIQEIYEQLRNLLS